MKKIIVSTTSDLVTDQRVQRVCQTLCENGFEILWIGRKRKNSLPFKKSYSTKRFRLIFNKGFLFYAEYNFRLFCLLLFTKKNLLLANDLDALLANYLVSKLQCKKLVYDSHELFTEIPELTNRPFVKKCWTVLESSILPKLANCYTVSDSIANFYNKKYKTHFQVIRNLPIQLKNKKKPLNIAVSNKKILLYQGALNIGRGLELMIKTMHYLENYILFIIGDGDITKQLHNKVSREKLSEKVLFLGKLTPEKLQEITPHANIGLSLEEDLGLNYRFALPNKIFDYIQAEVPILVSDLPEMKKVVLDYKIGEVIRNRNPKKIAQQITALLQKDFKIQLKIAKKELCWELEKNRLIAIFDQFES